MFSEIETNESLRKFFGGHVDELLKEFRENYGVGLKLCSRGPAWKHRNGRYVLELEAIAPNIDVNDIKVNLDYEKTLVIDYISTTSNTSTMFHYEEDIPENSDPKTLHCTYFNNILSIEVDECSCEEKCDHRRIEVNKK